MNPALARGHNETREDSYKARVNGKAGPASQGRRADKRGKRLGKGRMGTVPGRGV